MNWLFVLFMFEIILFALTYFLSGQDIMAPSSIFCIMFIVSTIFCFPYIKVWEIHYSVEAFLLIVVGIFTYILAENIVRSMSMNHRKQLIEHCSERETVDWPIIKIKQLTLILIILFNLLITFVYYLEIVNVVASYGFGSTNIIAAFRHISIGGSTKIESSASINRMVIHLIKIVKASGFVASFVLMSNKLGKQKKDNVYFFIITIQSLLPGLLSGGRTEIIRLISAILVEYYILWHQKNGWRKNNSITYVKLGAKILLIGIPLFYFLASVIGRSSSGNIFYYSAVYLGSGIVLFDLFCKSPNVGNQIWGQESLHDLMSTLGVNVLGGKNSLEFRSSGELNSNIYTFFRRPLSDFGVAGMCLFTAIIAIVFSWIYFCKIKGRKRNIKTDYYILMYGFLFYWIISSSTEQRSVNYISADHAEIMLLIIIGYKFTIYLNRKFSKKKSIYERRMMSWKRNFIKI